MGGELTRRRVTFGIAAAGAIAAGSARGQDRFSAQPIRLIVPFAAGGPADIVARLIAEPLKDRLGQVVVVDNRGGAGGVIGVDGVAKAEPNGATLGLGGTGALSVLPNLMPKMPYEVRRDIRPISVIAVIPQVLAVHAGLPARTAAELVALARSRPGTLNYASSGNGTSPHLAAELFLKQAGGLRVAHVPYRGAGPALTDLVAGHVQMMIADLPVMLPQLQAGTIRAIGVTSAERSPVLPDVPTIAEGGVPGVVSETYYGLIAPAGLSPDRVKALHAAAVAAAADPTVRARLTEQGARVVGNSPEEFAGYIAAESKKWGELIAAAQIKWD